MTTIKYKAHLAARSSTERQIEEHAAPLLKKAEEPGHVSTTFHPPVFAKVQAHQLIRSRSDDPNTAAQQAAMQNMEQPMGYPPVRNMFAGQGAYKARIFVKYNIS